MDYSISKTTVEERKELVKKALGISISGSDIPTDETLSLAKQYIEGKIENSFSVHYPHMGAKKNYVRHNSKYV